MPEEKEPPATNCCPTRILDIPKYPVTSVTFSNVVEEVDGITNYEYGTAEARDQKRDIRQKIAQMTGPANNPTLNQYGERLIDTRMTPDQKSAYERYLSEYRNR